MVNNDVTTQSSIVLIVLIVVFDFTMITIVLDHNKEHIELCDVTALFDIVLETNKHQNLARLRLTILIIRGLICGQCEAHVAILCGFISWRLPSKHFHLRLSVLRVTPRGPPCHCGVIWAFMRMLRS